MKKEIFGLNNIMTSSIVTWYLAVGCIVILGYWGIKIILGDHLKIIPFPLSAALLFIYLSIQFIKKSMMHKTVAIEIEEDNMIAIYFDGVLKVKSSKTDLKYISTLHYINEKNTIQAVLKFRNSVVNINDNNFSNSKNKTSFDTFLKYVEKEFQLKCVKAPFSLRYSKGYVNFFNPFYYE